MKTLIPVLFVLFLFSSCSQKVYRSLEWQSTRVTADGWIIEWPDQLRFIDDKTKISYAISNDLHNLYLCMRVADPTSKMKIIHGGMEFRIDTLGKNAFPIAFVFPTANEIVMAQDKRGLSQKDDNRGAKPAHPAMKQKILSPATEAQLVGFKHQFNGTVSLVKNTLGISAAINIDSLDVLCYEAIIPLNTFYKNELTKADTGRVFNYEIKINALPAPSTHEGGGGGGGGGRGMSGGGGGGGMGGGSRGGGQHGGMGGGGSHGGEHRGSGSYVAQNADLYVTSKVINKMKFSVK